MALAATTIAEIRTTGDDTNNGGLFDPGQTAGMFTDGAATSGNTASPVFSSVSYNFVAGDVGAWIYVGAGTNWRRGWYQIASVAANAATLSAAIGAAVLSTSNQPNGASISAGCASTASPTGATWSIDYSQQAAAQYTYTDLASSGTGLTVSSTLKPFAKEQVGNSIVITGGTNFNTGRYVIASVAAGVATVVGPGNITTGAGASGTGGQGGAFASIGMFGASVVASARAFILAGTYTTTSASTNIAAGCFSSSVQCTIQGYSSLRMDTGRATIIAGSTIATFTLVNATSALSIVRNLIVDGNNYTASAGIVSSSIQNCKGQNCKNTALKATGASTLIANCEATGCSTTAPALYCNGVVLNCYVHDNTVTGVWGTYNVNTISVNNTGASSRGFDDGFTLSAGIHVNCTAYGNGSDGFKQTNTGNGATYINCISYGNTGNGITGIAQTLLVQTCAFGSNAADISGVGTQNIYGKVTLTADPFTAKASNDYSLNNTAGGGALCRALGYPGAFPAATTTGYLDIGAVQHQDSLNNLGLIIQSIGTY